MSVEKPKMEPTFGASTSPNGASANNGVSPLSSLPPSLYRDQIPTTRANSGIAELFVVIGVCGTLAGMIAAAVQGAIADDFDMGTFAGILVGGACWGGILGLMISFFQSPRIVTIPVAIVFGPLVGATIAAVLAVPENYRINVGLASIGGAFVLGVAVIVIGRLRGKRFQ
jgi:hypothetical protein